MYPPQEETMQSAIHTHNKKVGSVCYGTAIQTLFLLYLFSFLLSHLIRTILSEDLPSILSALSYLNLHSFILSSIWSCWHYYKVQGFDTCPSLMFNTCLSYILIWTTQSNTCLTHACCALLCYSFNLLILSFSSVSIVIMTQPLSLLVYLFTPYLLISDSWSRIISYWLIACMCQAHA